MIKYDNKNWFNFIFTHSGKHIEGITISVVLMALLTTILIFLDLNTTWFHLDIDASFHTVLGLVLGLLLVFRTNSAYDRWWEGRKQLGALVNTSRNLAIKVNTYVQNETSEKHYLIDLINLFNYSLKEHLAAEDYESIAAEVPAPFRAKFETAQHKPNIVLAEIGKIIQSFHLQQNINGEQLIILEKETSLLINILGACERIKNTPIPLAYALHLKRVLLIYLVSLPFVMVNKLQWLSIPIVLVIFYTMVGIELIGEEIEDPFGMDENDLPVNELCDKIKANLAEIKNFN